MSEYSHEWICRNIVDGAPDAIIFADAGGYHSSLELGSGELFSGIAQVRRSGRTSIS